ncbi:hypothetical protein DW040_14620 [Blautia obeum]|uniref:Uncharacterized protein n=2 Tax=Blautia obeum TaxID=40520 RepID=A0A415HJV5_9FIRM|nr:hypothetical protein DW040_14620 [Blautia obeum]
MLVLLLDGERQVRYEISAMMQIIGKTTEKILKNCKTLFFVSSQALISAVKGATVTRSKLPTRVSNSSAATYRIVRYSANS